MAISICLLTRVMVKAGFSFQKVSVVILESLQAQQTFVNPLTCCEVINSSVISLEEEPGNQKKTLIETNMKGWACSLCATLLLFIMQFGLPSKLLAPSLHLSPN